MEGDATNDEATGDGEREERCEGDLCAANVSRSSSDERRLSSLSVLRGCSGSAGEDGGRGLEGRKKDADGVMPGA